MTTHEGAYPADMAQQPSLGLCMSLPDPPHGVRHTLDFSERLTGMYARSKPLMAPPPSLAEILSNILDIKGDFCHLRYRGNAGAILSALRNRWDTKRRQCPRSTGRLRLIADRKYLATFYPPASASAAAWLLNGVDPVLRS